MLTVNYPIKLKLFTFTFRATPLFRMTHVLLKVE